MSERDKFDRLISVAGMILEVYHRVASGESRGAGGCFYADGKATLNAVQIPVALLENLAECLGQRVHPRVSSDRYGNDPQQ